MQPGGMWIGQQVFCELIQTHFEVHEASLPCIVCVGVLSIGRCIPFLIVTMLVFKWNTRAELETEIDARRVTLIVSGASTYLPPRRALYSSLSGICVKIPLAMPSTLPLEQQFV